EKKAGKSEKKARGPRNICNWTRGPVAAPISLNAVSADQRRVGYGPAKVLSHARLDAFRQVRHRGHPGSDLWTAHSHLVGIRCLCVHPGWPGVSRPRRFDNYDRPGLQANSLSGFFVLAVRPNQLPFRAFPALFTAWEMFVNGKYRLLAA